MNNLATQTASPQDGEEEGARGWVLQELLPWHKQMCSLLVQGIDRGTIANILGKTPEYISMLKNQPLVKAHLKELEEFAEAQLQGMFVKSVEAIGEVLESGGHKEKIAAARLQLEATHRIGSKGAPEKGLIDTNARLTRLAERLLYLQGKGGQQESIIDAEFKQV